jgi:hypothetical protein
MLVDFDKMPITQHSPEPVQATKSRLSRNWHLFELVRLELTLISHTEVRMMQQEIELSKRYKYEIL